MKFEDIPQPSLPSSDPTEKPTPESSPNDMQINAETYPDHSDIKRNDILDVLKKNAEKDAVYKELLDELTNS